MAGGRASSEASFILSFAASGSVCISVSRALDGVPEWSEVRRWLGGARVINPNSFAICGRCSLKMFEEGATSVTS